MQIIVYHSKARKTMCGMGTFCLIGMISLQLTIQNGDFEILAIADIDFVVWAKSRVKDKKPVFFMMSRMTNTIFKSNFGVGIMFHNRTFTNTTAYFIFASSAGVEYKDMAL